MVLMFVDLPFELLTNQTKIVLSYFLVVFLDKITHLINI